MTIINYIKRGIDFIRHDLWRTSSDEVSKKKRLPVQILKTLILSVRGFNDNDISMRANALTYSFMFAIVPILSLILAVARGFGFESVIEGYLTNSFLGQYDPRIVEAIMGFVQRYLETAQNGAFVGVGILILLWAIYSFFTTVETSFNKIWQVHNSRNYFRQFANYVTILLAIPVVMIVSSGVSIAVNTTFSDAQFIDMSAFNEFMVKFLPWVTMWLAFFLMYWGIPNTKVRWYAALIPGILIGTLAQLLQMLGVYIFMFLGRTSIVYGAFAIIPLLLTWVQWLSLLILFGAELSYAIQNNEHFDYQVDTDQMSRRYKDYLTLYICHQIVKRFETGEHPYSTQELAQEDHLPVRIVNQLVGRLTEVNILSEIRSYEDEETSTRYQPAIDINKLSVGYLLERVEQGGSEEFFKKIPEQMSQFWPQWLELKRADYDFNRTLVKDLMKNNKDK